MVSLGPPKKISLKKPTQKIRLNLNTASKQQEIELEEKEFDTQRVVNNTSCVGTKEYHIGFLNGIYAARVLIYDLIISARYNYSPKLVEKKYIELVDHLDGLGEFHRERMGLIKEDDAAYEWYPTNWKTLFNIKENSNV